MLLSSHIVKGQKTERIACDYLKQAGLVLIAKNFHSKFGEIDLIMQDASYLVFVEVRFRHNDNYGHPLDTIDYKKQNKLLKTIQFFLLKNPQYEHYPARIDAVGLMQSPKPGVQGTYKGYDIQWIKNAIEV